MKAPIALALTVFMALSGTAQSGNADDAAFFKTATGTWSGGGEIVAGKYKGTRFNCSFAGTTPKNRIALQMDGACRVGVFTQKMNATISKTAGSYSGQFLDGAGGKGLDVVSGRVDGSSIVMGLRRAKLEGAMVARLASPDAMNVTISVLIGEDYRPIIGIKLKRSDDVVTGSIR